MWDRDGALVMTDLAPALMRPIVDRLRGAFEAEEADSQRRLVRIRLIAGLLIALAGGGTWRASIPSTTRAF